MFIQLTSKSGRRVVLNENKIVEIWERDEGAEIYTVTAAPGEYGVQVKESKSQILKMIGPVKAISEDPEPIAVKINMNSYVKIKLTDEGRKILENRYAQTNKLIEEATSGRAEKFEPTVDENGYFADSLWSIMKTFGDHVGLGMEVPFDTEMIFKRAFVTEKGEW